MWSIWFGFDRNCDVFVSIWVYKIVFRVKHLFFCLFPLKKIWWFKKWWFSCIKKFCFPLKKFIFYHNFLQKMCGFHLKNRYVSWWINKSVEVRKWCFGAKTIILVWKENVFFSFEKITNLSQFFLRNLLFRSKDVFIVMFWRKSACFNV